MTIIRQFAIGIILVTASALMLFSIVSAQSSVIGQAQINQIKTSCVSAKETIARLHANDALLRVNRGQMYESMTTKLMSRFDSRIDNNGLDSKALVTVNNAYSVALTTFRNDYIAYEVSLSSALKVDCTKEPITFYDAVADARTKRTQVHVDVIKLNQNIQDYKAAFDNFVTNYNKISGGSN